MQYALRCPPHALLLVRLPACLRRATPASSQSGLKIFQALHLNEAVDDEQRDWVIQWFLHHRHAVIHIGEETAINSIFGIVDGEGGASGARAAREAVMRQSTGEEKFIDDEEEIAVTAGARGSRARKYVVELCSKALLQESPRCAKQVEHSNSNTSRRCCGTSVA